MRFFLVILTIMSLFCIALISQSEASEELFLVRIVSINIEQKEMILEMVDIDRNRDMRVQNFDKKLLYKFKHIHESLIRQKTLKQGDVIRIWGRIDRINRISGLASINGRIAGQSDKIGEYDPTGVRKRLKKRIDINRPPIRGAVGGGR